MKELNTDGSETAPDRDAWLLGFEDRHTGEVICVQYGALVVKAATYTSRHREWHVRNGS